MDDDPTPVSEPALEQSVPRSTVGIRELKQNPSEIIARAARGERFDVLNNGKAVGVVIQRDSVLRSRWVTSDALTELTRAGTGDDTEWAHDVREARARENDPIVDPWGSAGA